jgi:hypothetical protein
MLELIPSILPIINNEYRTLVEMSVWRDLTKVVSILLLEHLRQICPGRVWTWFEPTTSCTAGGRSSKKLFKQLTNGHSEPLHSLLLLPIRNLYHWDVGRIALATRSPLNFGRHFQVPCMNHFGVTSMYQGHICILCQSTRERNFLASVWI